MKQRFIAVGVASLLAIAAGCSKATDAPTSPTGAAVDSTDAGSDGSTLKVSAPTLMSPTGGVRIGTTKPTLVIGNSQGKFADGDFEYRFEITTPDSNLVHMSLRVSADGSQISYDAAPDLQMDTRYRWRARAEMGPKHGPWSSYEEFLTIDYRGLVPRPANGQWPTTGPAVVAYIADSFPELLTVTATDDERIARMEYLRDRIIEAGQCGGLDLARNLKRGVGPHSIDAIAWRLPNGRVEVVDLASAYDDKYSPLHLHWLIVAGPPGYDPLPHPGC